MDSSTKTERKWDSISVRTDHEVPKKLHKLAVVLSKELGVGIHLSDAVSIAVREALAKRGVQP